MNLLRSLAVALAVVGAVVLVVLVGRWVQSGREPGAEDAAGARKPADPAGQAPRAIGPPAADAAGAAAPDQSPAERVSALVEALTRAVAADDRPAALAAARGLRAALIADPSLVAQILPILFDEQSPAPVREGLAVVLGSLPAEAKGKEAIAEGLRRGTLRGIEYAALLALGIQEIEDGQAFERDEEPYAVEINPFFTVTVHGELADANARLAAAGRLDAATPEERLAAARVLHDSTGAPEVRRALLAHLGAEADPEAAAEIAAGLADWTQTAPADDPERAAVVGRIFEVVPGSGEEVLFRLTAPLSGTPLGPEESERLRALATASASDETRRFAVEVLGRRLDPRLPAGEETLSLLTQAALSDSSPEVRETAALALSHSASDARAAQALAAALQGDADWEVRAAAARSLGRAGDSASARESLQRAAAGDSHPDVRAAAQESLEALSGQEPETPR